MSTKVTQKEAVFSAITNVLKQNKVTVSEGQDYAPLMNKDLRSSVNQILFEGFRNETIELGREYSDSDLKAYTSGVISNWLRKDKRLNGGVTYSAKNPGSRAGSGDSSLQAMRALMKTLKTEADRAEVQGFINTRLSEIQASKVKAVSIDYTALPAGLAAKFQK